MPRNVSRDTLHALRRERRQNPTLGTLIGQRRRESPEERAIRERAEELYRRFQADGTTWAACVQAVKTDWVASFLARHETRRRDRGGASPTEPKKA